VVSSPSYGRCLLRNNCQPFAGSRETQVLQRLVRAR